MSVTGIPAECQDRSDAHMIASGRCPICEKVIGVKRSRHSLTTHLNRAIDLEHRMWVTANYRRHFRHGRSKKTPPAVQREVVMQLLARHVGEDMMRELLNINT